MRDHAYFVYMLASGYYGTLYIGVANDLLRRITEHRQGLVPGFTRRYGVKCLVRYEQHGDIQNAIGREKTLKRWRRDWKIALLEGDNPHWNDLFPVLADNGSVRTLSLRTRTAPCRGASGMTMWALRWIFLMLPAPHGP